MGSGDLLRKGTSTWQGARSVPKLQAQHRSCFCSWPGSEATGETMGVLAGIPGLSLGTGRWGRAGWSRPQKSPQAFPIRKHILLVSGSVAGPLFVAVGYALLLTKNSLKNNHFLSAERQGKLARARARTHTHTHTHTRTHTHSFLWQALCFPGPATRGGRTRTEPRQQRGG
jgi:hypothetical protein